jgi:hypothetical protein
LKQATVKVGGHREQKSSSPVVPDANFAPGSAGLGLYIEAVLHCRFVSIMPVGGKPNYNTMMTNRTCELANSFKLPDTQGHLHQLLDHENQWRLLVFHRHLG